jgi:hypothetical protein
MCVRRRRVVLVRAFVDESRDPTPRSIDPVGQLLFIAAIGTLTYALIESLHTGWRSPLIVGLLIGLPSSPPCSSPSSCVPPTR